MAITAAKLGRHIRIYRKKIIAVIFLMGIGVGIYDIMILTGLNHDALQAIATNPVGYILRSQSKLGISGSGKLPFNISELEYRIQTESMSVLHTIYHSVLVGMPCYDVIVNRVSDPRSTNGTPYYPALPPSITEHVCWLVDVCEEESLSPRNTHVSEELCPCIPEGLTGRITVDFDKLMSTPWDVIEERNPTLRPGGHWRPEGCVPRKKVSVIVPFRDRENQLRAFLAHTHPALQRQLVEYRVFVVEQNLPYLFNKAALMNIGYLESKKVFDSDCVLFHDVDALTERDDNILACGDDPVHWGGYSDRFNYTYLSAMFGAAVLIRDDVFESANGFSNLFYGWGGEDDNMRHRFIQLGKKVIRGPMEITRCSIFDHSRVQSYNRSRFQEYRRRRLFTQLAMDPMWRKLDGLTSTVYDVINNMDFLTHTRFHVNLKRPIIRNRGQGRLHKHYGYFTTQAGDIPYGTTIQDFNITYGYCADPPPEVGRHFLSRVTCRQLCERDRGCKYVEYFEKPLDALDSYCLLREMCKIKLKPSSASEVHTKLGWVKMPGG